MHELMASLSLASASSISGAIRMARAALSLAVTQRQDLTLPLALLSCLQVLGSNALPSGFRQA